jgi:hypothetical protein
VIIGQEERWCFRDIDEKLEDYDMLLKEPLITYGQMALSTWHVQGTAVLMGPCSSFCVFDSNTSRQTKL